MIDLEKNEILYNSILLNKTLICFAYLLIIVSCAAHEFLAVPGFLIFFLSMERIRTLHVEAEYSFNHDPMLENTDRLRIMLSWVSVGINVPVAYLNLTTMMDKLGLDSKEIRSNTKSLLAITSNREVYMAFLAAMCVIVSVVMLITHLITPDPMGLIYAVVLGMIHANFGYLKDSFIGACIAFLYCTNKEKYEDEIHKYIRKQYQTYQRG